MHVVKCNMQLNSHTQLNRFLKKNFLASPSCSFTGVDYMRQVDSAR